MVYKLAFCATILCPAAMGVRLSLISRGCKKSQRKVRESAKDEKAKIVEVPQHAVAEGESLATEAAAKAEEDEVEKTGRELWKFVEEQNIEKTVRDGARFTYNDPEDQTRGDELLEKFAKAMRKLNAMDRESHILHSQRKTVFGFFNAANVFSVSAAQYLKKKVDSSLAEIKANKGELHSKLMMGGSTSPPPGFGLRCCERAGMRSGTLGSIRKNVKLIKTCKLAVRHNEKFLHRLRSLHMLLNPRPRGQYATSRETAVWTCLEAAQDAEAEAIKFIHEEVTNSHVAGSDVTKSDESNGATTAAAGRV